MTSSTIIRETVMMEWRSLSYNPTILRIVVADRSLCFRAMPIVVMFLLLCLIGCSGRRLRMARVPINGTLRVDSSNPRYFADESGRAILLTGSTTWANLVDIGRHDPPRSFDYPGYLDFLVKNNHNFFRLYAWEQSHWFPDSPVKSAEGAWFAPLPYVRTTI
jgi:hypothetical protein